MSDWSGFTDEEFIKKLRAESESEEQKSTPKVSRVGQQPKRKPREKKITSHQTVTERIAPKPIEEKSLVVTNSSTDINVNNSKEEEERSAKETKEETVKNYNLSNDVGVLSDEKVAELEMSRLEQLQLKQKLIEEQNKKKQEMIKQTLQQRFKQTQSESQKLKDIQKQLAHLDQILQTDVELLRNKIDEACLLFSQAQRRYGSAESEYVAAKLDYFHKKEQKEQLTEHLYSIIQDNELRKAKKLEEIMSKLSSGSDSIPSSPTSHVSSVVDEHLSLVDKQPTVSSNTPNNGVANISMQQQAKSDGLTAMKNADEA